MEVDGLFSKPVENKDERNQLLQIIHKHAEYIDYPNNINLKNKIADHIIAENGYCF